MADPDNDPSDQGQQLQIQFTDKIHAVESIIVSDDGLVERMRDIFGDELRVVGAYNEHTFEFLYADAEITEQYTEEELIATGDEFILSGQREDTYQEQLFHLGELEYNVRGFEDGQVLRISLTQATGLTISVASTANVSLPQFIDQLTHRHDDVFR